MLRVGAGGNQQGFTEGAGFRLVGGIGTGEHGDRGHFGYEQRLVVGRGRCVSGLEPCGAIAVKVVPDSERLLRGRDPDPRHRPGLDPN